MFHSPTKYTPEPAEDGVGGLVFCELRCFRVLYTLRVHAAISATANLALRRQKKSDALSSIILTRDGRCTYVVDDNGSIVSRREACAETL